MHLTLHHHPHVSRIAAEGHLTGANVDGVVDMLSMVPVDQPLIVDLLAVASIDDLAASALHEEFRERALRASVTVVVDDLDVRMQLVLRDVDRCSQLVHSGVDTVGALAGQG